MWKHCTLGYDLRKNIEIKSWKMMVLHKQYVCGNKKEKKKRKTSIMKEKVHERQIKKGERSLV